MRKRFMITMDDDIHRKLTVEAAHQGRTVGDLIRDLVEGPKIVNLGPNASPGEVAMVKQLYETGHTSVGALAPLGTLKEAAVENPVKKGIEPEQVKTTNGKLSKGLGTLPGQLPPQPRPEAVPSTDRGIGFSRPAPKPGTKK